MADPWPTPWIVSHRAPCPACGGSGDGRGLTNRPCRTCRGLGFVSKPAVQIVAEMLAEGARP